MKVALALDGFGPSTKQNIMSFAEKCWPYVDTVKIGLELFTRFGPEAFEFAGDREIFLDLKLHDIPNTVGWATHEASKHKVTYLTVHYGAGTEAILRAHEMRNDVKLLLVVVLTSSTQTLFTPDIFIEAAKFAKKHKIFGLVSPVNMIEEIYKANKKAFVVTPGIRTSGTRFTNDDQKAIALPSEAYMLGSDMIVLGRSVTLSSDPVRELKSVQRFRGKK